MLQPNGVKLVCKPIHCQVSLRKPIIIPARVTCQICKRPNLSRPVFTSFDACLSHYRGKAKEDSLLDVCSVHDCVQEMCLLLCFQPLLATVLALTCCDRSCSSKPHESMLNLNVSTVHLWYQLVYRFQLSFCVRTWTCQLSQPWFSVDNTCVSSAWVVTCHLCAIAQSSVRVEGAVTIWLLEEVTGVA